MSPGSLQKTLMASVSTLVIIIFSSAASAFPTYDGCKDCHKGFEKSPYISLRDGTNWGDDLMDRHTTFAGGSCDSCHKSGSKGEVYLNFSIDSSLPKSCVGCHGRDQDVNGNCTDSSGGRKVECGSGAGLRLQHELKVGVDTCNSCHSGDPTPVGEHIAPFNYGRGGVLPKNSCDADGTESQVGATGLDNDGDGQRDAADSDCQLSTLSCIELGALAYDNWTKPEAGGMGRLPHGASDPDYIRCKACHGWDLAGTDGGYGRRLRNAGQANAGYGDGDQTSRNISQAGRDGANVTADMILHPGTGRSFADGAGSWVELDNSHSAANKAAYSRAYTLGNQHPDFSGGDMTREQIECLAEFLNLTDADPGAYFADINPNQKPVSYTMIEMADAVAGEAFYNVNCSGCHGDPATDHNGNNGGMPAGGILAYLAGDGKFSEFSHKARWGIPDTIMNRSAIGSPGSTDVANMMLWLQDTGGTGFAISPGLSGHWWNGESRSGEGFLLDVSKDASNNLVVIASFYTYNYMGNQVWIVGAGPVVGNEVVIEFEITEGARWGADFNPGDVARPPWGSGRFTFTSCGDGYIELVPNTDMVNAGFTGLEYEINRVLLIPGVVCPTPAD